jgi:hypothetical protein
MEVLQTLEKEGLSIVRKARKGAEEPPRKSRGLLTHRPPQCNMNGVPGGTLWDLDPYPCGIASVMKEC